MKTVLIDFDGVIHSYTSGWQGHEIIPDSPMPGAIQWLRELIASEDIEPVIYTTRVGWTSDEEVLAAEKALAAIKQWLYLEGLSAEEISRLPITAQKRPAVLLIDDRAFQFQGTFPTEHFIRNFEPWRIEHETTVDD